MRKTFLSYFYCFTILVAVKSQQVKQCWNQGSEMAKTPYFIGNGFTCCNNILMDQPIKPKSEHWRKCMSQQAMDNEDIPNTLWKTYLCELSSASQGMFSETNLTYKSFETFFMKNYPTVVKDQILAKDIKCEIPDNADIKMKLKKFEDCFLQVEEDICVSMSGAKPANIQKPQQKNEKICEPIESLKKPNHAFETFAQPCCKGEELPYPLFDILMDFDRFDISQKHFACNEKLSSRLIELNYPGVKPDEPLTMCQVACVHQIDGLPGEYNTNFQDLLNFKLKSVSNTTKATLLSIVAKYQPQFQLIGDDANKAVAMEKAEELISKMEEGSKILNYCKFQFEATAEVYRALYEYCYNSDYGNQFREDIIKTTGKN